MDRDSWVVEEAVSDQDHPQGKDIRKAEWLSEEDLQIAEKRREAKGKVKKESYTNLNAEF